MDAGQTATISHVGHVENEEANTPLALSRSHGVFNLPSYPDIGVLSHDELKNEKVRIELPQEAWPDCQKFQFSATCTCNKQRKLNPQLLMTNDSVVCVYCALFGQQEKVSQQEGSFVSIKGVSDWSNIGRLVKLHTCELSPHHDAVIKGDNFAHISSGNQKDIYSYLASKISKTVERNRHILQAIIDVVVLCGKQNFALRGHREENSNFLTLFQFRAKTDPVHAGHLNSDESRAIPKYTSPDIQNELIERCDDYIRKLLLQNCSSAPFSLSWQMKLQILEQRSRSQYVPINSVHIKEGENKERVREDFLGFLEGRSTKHEGSSTN